MVKSIGAIAVALALVAPNAWAEDKKPVADVKSVTGLVMTDLGSERQAAQVGLPLREGDRVLTGTGAGAGVRYNDGCDIEVKENSIFTVTTPSVCGGGILSLEQFAVSPIAGGFALKGALLPLAGAVGAAAVISATNDNPASPQ